jgi:hypothetical protein
MVLLLLRPLLAGIVGRPWIDGSSKFARTAEWPIFALWFRLVRLGIGGAMSARGGGFFF